MKQTLKKVFATCSIGASLMLPVGSVLAASNPFIQGQNLANQVAGDAGISSQKTLPQLIGQIINIILSLLGMVFLILVLYAGFLWMTAAGDEKGVTKAKEILRQAIIGLIVIVAGFAISNFVLGNLVNVANGT
ncbi:hypothetical protein IT408_03605 [Candidatus Uhrbacteria bacterium]|nr:hypothetical protein [Candidatus Uhrbacteria bacterium]